MKPIPTPADIEARLSAENTGLRDRVIAVLDGAKKTTGVAVKIGSAGEAEVKRITKELEQHWRVALGEVEGAKVLLLTPPDAGAKRAVEGVAEAAKRG